MVHAVNFNQRFYAQNLHAREAIAAGELGDVRLVSGGFLQDWLLYDTDWSWRLEREQGGDLRVVGDIGSHWLDLDELPDRPPRRRRDGRPDDLHARAQAAGRPRRDVRDRGDRRDASTARSRPRTPRPCSCASRAARAASPRSRRSAPGARTTCTGRSTARSRPPPGAPSGRRSCGSATASAPNELRCASRASSRRTPRAHTSMPAGHAEGFGETFRELYRAVYTAVAAGAPPAQPDYPTFAAGTSRR